MAERKLQPRCTACGHPRSFHGNGETECRALGCDCQLWEAPADTDDDEPVAAAG